MHNAFLAFSTVTRVVVSGIEEVVETVLILHNRPGSNRRIRIGHLTVFKHHAVVLKTA